MATPIENAQTLQAFWKANFSDAFQDRATPLVHAMLAMKELVDQSSTNPSTRLEVFGKQAIFNAALFEYGGWVDQLIASARAQGGLPFAFLAQGDRELRPPRQIMLDGIYRAGTGGLFSPKDPSGVTSWVYSETVASGALVGTLKGDPVPGVRAAALRIVRDLAIPEMWVTFFKDQAVFASVDETIKQADWSTGDRRTLTALSAGAAGRVDTELAKSAAGALPALPMFPTGDGSRVPTTLPPPKRWYQNGPMIASGVGGVIGGMMLKLHAKR